MQQVTALAACNSSVQTALLQCFSSISKGCTFFLRQIKKNWNMPHRYGTTPSNATPLKSKLYAVKRGTFHLPWLQTYYHSHSHVTETAVGLSPAAHSRVLMLYHICNGLVAITASIYLQPTVDHAREFETSYRQIQCNMDTGQIGDRPYRWQLNRWHIKSVTSQFGDNITQWQVISVTEFNSNVKCSHRPIVYDNSAVPGTCR